MEDFLDEYFNDEYFWDEVFNDERIEKDQIVFYPKYDDELEKENEIEESYDEFDYYYDEWKERRIYGK